MNRRDFRKEYAAIASAMGSHFHDGNAHDDERTAREIRSDLPAGPRARLISKILEDADRLLPNLENCWKALAEESNRQAETANEAREWLDRMVVIWENELARIRKDLLR